MTRFAAVPVATLVVSIASAVAVAACTSTAVAENPAFITIEVPAAAYTAIAISTSGPDVK